MLDSEQWKQMCEKYGTRNFSVYRDIGIPGPRPFPFAGTSLYMTYYGLYDFGALMKKRYGNIVSLFNGSTPVLLVFDEEMIRQVCVKQFYNFGNRSPFKFGDPITDSMLSILRDEKWKHIRSIMSPSFTTGKLRGMASEINRCAKQFAEKVMSKGGPMEMQNLSGRFTMDVIASTAFGLRVNSQDDENSSFVVHGKKFVDIGFRNLSMIIAFMFPGLLPYLCKLGYSTFDKKAMNFFIQVTEQTLNGRQGGDKSHNDFIQLMANAQKGEQIHDDSDATEVENLTVSTGLQGMTRDEILGNALIFFLAGYDGTSLGLTQLLYALATNPECQDKLFEEIKSQIGDKTDLTYDLVNKMHYLDQCLQESLRLYTPAPVIDRQASADIEINGIKIKKGTVVMVPVYAIHHDPEIWHEPEKFNPDRFAPDAKQGHSAIQWQPFGLGPRNCIGMRLVLLEIKMAVVQLLRTHKLVPCEKTEVPQKFSMNKFMKAENGVWLAVEKR